MALGDMYAREIRIKEMISNLVLGCYFENSIVFFTIRTRNVVKNLKKKEFYKILI